MSGYLARKAAIRGKKREAPTGGIGAAASCGAGTVERCAPDTVAPCDTGSFHKNKVSFLAASRMVLIISSGGTVEGNDAAASGSAAFIGIIGNRGMRQL